MLHATGAQRLTLMSTIFLGFACAESDPGRPTPTTFHFDKYHTVGEFEAYLHDVTSRHEDLATLVEIGRSREDQPILAVEINNAATGPAAVKPAFYVDGNIHGGEVLGGEAALYFIDRLLTEYGKDADITSLVDTKTFYVVPLVNPDGRAISVDTPENHRWNVRPSDEDDDGLVDEDPPEDLDGDGRILQMRIPDTDGGWKIAPGDARMMIRRANGETGGRYYRVLTEGTDNDGDGEFNEDRVGGVDLNRNFPSNWSAAQFASGPYPLSEPETHALVDYITARPNIAAIHTFHTSGGLILRFPTLAHQDWEFPRPDLEDYREIADAGVALTGYEHYAFEKQPIVDLMSPGHGVFNDWGSNVFGVLAITTELWKRPLVRGPEAIFAWNDEVLNGEGFIDWYAFQHSQLGAVELGGWDRWSTSSPPEHLIEGEIDRNVRWVLTFAGRLPQMEILHASTSRDGSTENAIEVTVVVANVGWMATATEHAASNLGIAEPVRVALELSNAKLVTGDAERDLGVLPGARDGGPDERTLTWTVRVLDADAPATAEVVVRSQKAGTVRQQVSLTDTTSPSAD